MKNIHIYQIARDYSKATVWTGSKMTHACLAVTTITPKGATRPERHAEISAFLYKEFEIPGPCYRDTDDQNDPTTEGSVLTCVYCGQAYPQGTPAWGSQILTDHIKVCEKHPMRALEADYTKLRQALVGVIGSDTPKDLEVMEAWIRQMPNSEEDKAKSINAIHALRDTAPKT